MSEKAAQNPPAPGHGTQENQDAEKQKRQNELYSITGKGLKVIGIFLVAYMAVSVILAYFLRVKSSMLITGIIVIIAVAYPIWLYLVLRAAGRLRKLKSRKE